MTFSSHPLEDAEEFEGRDAVQTDGDEAEREAALDAMPEGNAEQRDTVAEEPSDPDVSDWDPRT